MRQVSCFILFSNGVLVLYIYLHKHHFILLAGKCYSVSYVVACCRILMMFLLACNPNTLHIYYEKAKIFKETSGGIFHKKHISNAKDTALPTHCHILTKNFSTSNNNGKWSIIFLNDPHIHIYLCSSSIIV